MLSTSARRRVRLRRVAVRHAHIQADQLRAWIDTNVSTGEQYCRDTLLSLRPRPRTLLLHSLIEEPKASVNVDVVLEELQAPQSMQQRCPDLVSQERIAQQQYVEQIVEVPVPMTHEAVVQVPVVGQQAGAPMGRSSGMPPSRNDNNDNHDSHDNIDSNDSDNDHLENDVSESEEEARRIVPAGWERFYPSAKEALNPSERRLLQARRLEQQQQRQQRQQPHGTADGLEGEPRGGRVAVVIADADGEGTAFHAEPSMHAKELMSAWCEMYGVHMDDVEFRMAHRGGKVIVDLEPATPVSDLAPWGSLEDWRILVMEKDEVEEEDEEEAAQ